MLEVYCW